MTGHIDVIVGLLSQSAKSPLTFTITAGFRSEGFINNYGYADYIYGGSGGPTPYVYGSVSPDPLIFAGSTLTMIISRLLVTTDTELRFQFLTQALPRDFFSRLTIEGPSYPLTSFETATSNGWTTDPPESTYGAGTQWRWDNIPLMATNQTYTVIIYP